MQQLHAWLSMLLVHCSDLQRHHKHPYPLCKMQVDMDSGIDLDSEPHWLMWLEHLNALEAAVGGWV